MNATSALRILVAEDHPIYREGLIAALHSLAGVEIVATCARGDEAFDAILEHRPDVAVLDHRMPGADAEQILAQLDGSVETRVLVLSAMIDADTVARTLEAGAAGYLAKESSRETICRAVLEIAGGGTVIGPEVQAGLVDHLRDRGSRRRSFLSDREQEVLALLADGLSGPQIAERLIIGHATVKTHLHHLYEKLGVSDRAAAVAEGMRRGLLR